MAVLAVPPVPPTLDTLGDLYNSDLEYGMIEAKVADKIQLKIMIYMQFLHVYNYSSKDLFSH